MAQMPEIIVLRKKKETKTTIEYEELKPKTNADRIRAMTDEELMEFLEHDYWSIDYCKKDAPIDQETKECLLPSCKQCWLEWLKQEADG